MLGNNSLFLYNHAAELHEAKEHVTSLNVIERCTCYYNDMDIQMLIASNYKALGNYPEAVSFVSGCTTNDDELALESELINIDFEMIGVEHNKGLDYIYENLSSFIDKKNGIELRSYNINSLYEIVEDASVSFVMMSDYGSGLKKDDLFEITNLAIPKTMLRRSDAVVDNLTNSAINDQLTKKQQYYLEKFNDILLSANANAKKGAKKVNIEQIISQLNKLDLTIKSKCSSEEAIPLLAATSVGRHSLQYWNDNLYKWVALVENDKKLNPLNNIVLKSGSESPDDDEWEWFVDTLIDMGQSDGIGALIGAGAGALAGGVGAVPGAISGACYASTGAGVKSLLQRWGIFS